MSCAVMRTRSPPRRTVPSSTKSTPSSRAISWMLLCVPRRVIDIARLLHVTPTVPGMEAGLDHRVVLAFHSAGWPLQRIVEEYRPNLKSPSRIDVALLVDEGQCVVAVEVKRDTGPNWNRRLREAWAQ